MEGCMPVVAKAGAQWNGIESFIGKKVAVNPSYFAFTGAVMDLGYDNPLEAVDWEIYSDYNDALGSSNPWGRRICTYGNRTEPGCSGDGEKRGN